MQADKNTLQSHFEKPAKPVKFQQQLQQQNTGCPVIAKLKEQQQQQQQPQL